MLEQINVSLIDWSRAQFALTAMYHWLFVPLTLGLALLMGIMETLYVATGKEQWKHYTKFWMKIFGINFVIGVATGLILEFEFGTNWSNYSWFVGDIFGAPLAIEGILAFFLEATFVAVMFFGWGRVGKRFHLVSTWLTGVGAAISAWWILVANSWMQHPVGMTFNPDTMRNEMQAAGSFWEVAFSDVAVVKFFHTVLSCWVLGAVFVVGISCWYLLKKRHEQMALSSIKIASIFGLFSSLVVAMTGDTSAYQVAQTQPMKLAAIEGLYDGGTQQGLTAIGLLNPAKERYDDGVEPFLFEWKMPYALSFLATRDIDGYVPGINDIIAGGYTQPDGTTALSAGEKMDKGRQALETLDAYRQLKQNGEEEAAVELLPRLERDVKYLGYGYITDEAQLVPNVPLNFYAFRVMVGLGCYFILFFAVVLFLIYKKRMANVRWMQWVGLWTIPLAYIAGQAGWIVAEVGRQPWAIQDLLPVNAAISAVSVGSVRTTFFLFFAVFTIVLAAGICIVVRIIKKGPEQLTIDN